MNPPSTDAPPSAVAHSTHTGAAIARAVEGHWPAGGVEGCRLLRRGFNDVYELQLAQGRRCIARLSALRARGEANADYEAALLAHLKAGGAHVATALPTRDDAHAIALPALEGPRTLMLFEHLDGEPPGDVLADVEAAGRGLARIHAAGANYDGPPSRYALTLPHLLHQPLQWLLAAPTLDDALRADFAALAVRVAARIDAPPMLARGACHGDCHGGNMFVTDGPGGERIASFFDFDDTGPGYLAYDLGTRLWSFLLRTAEPRLDEANLERWRGFLQGYRSVRVIAPADFDAVAAFVAVRHFWFMGEYASRMPEWGTQTMPPAWLRKQVALMTAWESLQTPS